MDWQASLKRVGYLAAEDLADIVDVAVALERPLLLEGPAGVGKTALARALSQVLDRPLVRLQCYEGIDATQALYDWNYARQLADLARDREQDPFQPAYLLARPLLRALTAPTGAVLLVDEIDRADEAFEALLLEILAEKQVSIPELGTVSGQGPLYVVLTSNRTRALSDALRRRCLFHRLSWPEPAREQAILRVHEPDAPDTLLADVVTVVGRLRTWDLVKPPGVAESVDLTRALVLRGRTSLDAKTLRSLLGTVIKDSADWDAVNGRLEDLFTDG